ncbi:FAD-binding-3 domain-containing protein [Favolaschia claudopus]|uniref:FAD-binding-3 domain-containing protein n=1 Tax=Favolaschia claudopus TaxID=2862362 RepID=A0AAW0DCW9_9AGAR
MDKPAVLIVGAGPSGLVLALILLQCGISVRIIDKQTTYSVGSRGAAIQPPGELLRPTLAKYNHGDIDPTTFVKVVDIVEPTPDLPYPNAYYISQVRHEEVLRSHLRKLSCDVELGSELRSLEQFPDHVVAHIEKTDSNGNKVEEKAEFHWLVGTDGARSVVRKQIGVEYLGETRAQCIALGDIIIEEGVDPRFWHSWDGSAKSIIFRPSGVTDKSFMFFYTGRSEESSNTTITREELVNDFREITGRQDVKFGSAPWLSNYRPNIRMVDKMQVGRVFLAGDAAHCHSLTGGQGLNSGVHDSFNLGWKLALVHHGRAAQTLLQTYDEERLRVIAYMLRFTTALHNQSFERLQAGKKMEDASWDRGGDLQMLGVNYSGSSIILQETDAVAGINNAYSRPVGSGPASVEASFRAPDASGLVAAGSAASSTTTLFSVFNVTTHSVLFFGRDADCSARISDVVARIPRGIVRAVRLLPQGETGTGPSPCEIVLEDRTGSAYGVYGAPLDKLTIVIVRPDGVVGAVVPDIDGVQRYFANFVRSNS